VDIPKLFSFQYNGRSAYGYPHIFAVPSLAANAEAIFQEMQCFAKIHNRPLPI
jgi:hypothetical protein